MQCHSSLQESKHSAPSFKCYKHAVVCFFTPGEAAVQRRPLRCWRVPGQHLTCLITSITPFASSAEQQRFWIRPQSRQSLGKTTLRSLPKGHIGSPALRSFLQANATRAGVRSRTFQPPRALLLPPQPHTPSENMLVVAPLSDCLNRTLLFPARPLLIPFSLPYFAGGTTDLVWRLRGNQGFMGCPFNTMPYDLTSFQAHS